MRIKIKTKNFPLLPDLDTLVEEKLGKPVKELLGKLDVKADILLEVELAKITKHHHKGRIWEARANLALPNRKSVLRAESVTEDIRQSLTEAKHLLFREIEKYRESPRAKTAKTRGKR